MKTAFLFLLLLLAGPAHAARPVVGFLVAMEDTVRINGKTATMDAPIHQADTIETDMRGRALILMNDTSEIALSADARLSIDAFDPDGKLEARYAVEQGAFLYTGAEAGGGARITTPLGTLRGEKGAAFWGGKLRGRHTLLATTGTVRLNDTALHSGELLHSGDKKPTRAQAADLMNAAMTVSLPQGESIRTKIRDILQDRRLKIGVKPR
jgi:hypothetical protein